MLRMITNLFPLWAVLLSAAALFQPHWFVDFKSLIVPLLAVIMLSMGLTLKPADFANVLKNRAAVTVGVALQFTVMPLVALLVARVMQFDPTLTVGMILVGCVAGGTASNVMCFLAKGDVALSISMTALSTLIGVAVTPLLVELLAGQSVDIPVAGMFVSLLKVVLLPVVVGVVVNTYLHRLVERVALFLPLISMAVIVFIIAIVVALTAGKLREVGPVVLVAVMMHNAIGLAAGYWVTLMLGFDKRVCRTIAFEVGLQNSGLATALAMKFFAPGAAIAGSIFSIWHNISGSALAGYWSRRQRGCDAVMTES